MGGPGSVGGGCRHRGDVDGDSARAGLWVWKFRAVTLGTEISPSLSFLLCKMGITAPPGGTNLTGTSLRQWGRAAGALTSLVRAGAGVGAQVVGSLAGGSGA